jgi:hypothetical protein
VIPASVGNVDGLLTATLHSAAAGAPHFALSLEAFDSGAARLRVLEKTDQAPRWEVSRHPRARSRARAPLAAARSPPQPATRLSLPPTLSFSLRSRRTSCRRRS